MEASHQLKDQELDSVKIGATALSFFLWIHRGWRIRIDDLKQGRPSMVGKGSDEGITERGICWQDWADFNLDLAEILEYLSCASAPGFKNVWNDGVVDLEVLVLVEVSIIRAEKKLGFFVETLERERDFDVWRWAREGILVYKGLKYGDWMAGKWMSRRLRLGLGPGKVPVTKCSNSPFGEIHLIS